MVPFPGGGELGELSWLRGFHTNNEIWQHSFSSQWDFLRKTQKTVDFSMIPFSSYSLEVLFPARSPTV